MTVSQGASSQAGQQGQESGTQTSQGGQQQSLGDQLYGQQGQQGQSQPGAGEGQLLEGQHAGESLADYAKRINSELTRARNDAGKYRTQLRQVMGEQGTQGEQQGSTQQQGQETNPLAKLQETVSQLQRDLANERTARKTERTESSLTNALTKAGAVNPMRAMRMIDASELQAGADGVPTQESIDEAIEALRADMPQIFTDVRGTGDGNAGNAGAGESDDFNAQIRRRAGLRR